MAETVTSKPFKFMKWVDGGKSEEFIGTYKDLPRLLADGYAFFAEMEFHHPDKDQISWHVCECIYSDFPWYEPNMLSELIEISIREKILSKVIDHFPTDAAAIKIYEKHNIPSHMYKAE